MTKKVIWKLNFFSLKMFTNFGNNRLIIGLTIGICFNNRDNRQNLYSCDILYGHIIMTPKYPGCRSTYRRW